MTEYSLEGGKRDLIEIERRDMLMLERRRIPQRPIKRVQLYKAAQNWTELFKL